MVNAIENTVLVPWLRLNVVDTSLRSRDCCHRDRSPGSLEKSRVLVLETTSPTPKDGTGSPCQ